MTHLVFDDRSQTGAAAAAHGAKAIRAAIAQRGHANLIVATGASQLEMLQQLVKLPDIAWDKVTAFHLDEYVGLPTTHPASFRRYLWDRFVKLLPLPLAAFHYVNGDGNPLAECVRLHEIIRRHPIDVAFVGIGENGHLAFNDPPADFETEAAYLVVDLDPACRKQQLGEGWFSTIEDVPTKAISMSVRQILMSREIICTSPDRRKAIAVRDSLEGPVTNHVPASILQRHERTTLFLDRESAALLSRGA